MSQFLKDIISVDGEVLSGPRTLRGSRFRFPVPVSKLPSRTKQADAKSADINEIVRRYKKTGELPVNRRMALFEDLPAIDLKDAMDLMVRAEQSFAQLPSAVRAKYNNDPSALMADIDTVGGSDLDKVKAAHGRLFEAGMLPKAWEDPTPPASPEASPAPSTGEKV